MIRPRESAVAAGPLVECAPAKVNLTLRVLGRRADGYHELESLVAFASVGDRLELLPDPDLELMLKGPKADLAGPPADNLVLKAARALAARVEGLRLGRFVLTKRLPVAAGLGGGSADAAAALRLLARSNGLGEGDPRLLAAAAATGADVPVCLASLSRIMRGRGDILSDPIELPPLPAILVNPGVHLPTGAVFAALDLAARAPHEPGPEAMPPSRGREALLAFLRAGANDLEPAAIKLEPVIAEVLAALRGLEGARLARMSGSGATCFALFDSARAAERAARALRADRPGWWIRTARLAGVNAPGRCRIRRSRSARP